MLKSPHPDTQHKIVVLNAKGGCGKTTLATNLAGHFATVGPPPTLIDFDPQGYSMRWLERRPAERPKIFGLAGHEGHRKPWHESRHVIVDLPAALTPEQILDYTYDANSILIPVLPSAIDAYSASRFIAELLLNAQIDRRDRQLAVIANRTRRNTRSYRMLMRFLTSLEIPLITELRDSQNFVHAAAQGLSVSELPEYRARRDLECLTPLYEWLEDWQLRRMSATVTPRYELVGGGAPILTPAALRLHR